MYNLEFVSAIIFFAGLIVVYNLRSVIESENKQSYRYMTSGLLIMSLSSLSLLVVQQNVLSNILIINNSLFTQVMYWIGMITGLTLLLSGVSSWLPVYRNNLKYNSLELHKIELFKKIEQLIRFENRNNIVLLQAIELVLNHYDFDEVGCYLFSQQKKKMTFLGAVDNLENSSLKSHHIHFDNESIVTSIQTDNLELDYNTDAQKYSPDLLLPMVIEDKLLGVICIYSDDEIDSQSVSNLQLILEILSSKLIENALSIKNNSMLQQQKWQEKINNSICSTKSVKESMVVCKNLLQEFLPVDFMTISYSTSTETYKSTIAENNQVLESCIDQTKIKNELENYVLTHNIPVVIGNLESETNFIVDITALKLNMKSMIAFPIINEMGAVGVVVVGSTEYNLFSDSSVQNLKSMNPYFERMINNSVSMNQAKEDFHRKESLRKLLYRSTTLSNSTTLFQNVSDYLIGVVNARIVRVSLFDSDNRFLNSQVMSTSEHDNMITPDDATMMLALMPNHRKVLLSRNTVQVTNDNEFETEMIQIYGDKLTSLTIVPFYYDSNIVGVITVGSADEKYKVSERDMNHIEDVAHLVTMHMQIKNKSMQIQKLKSQLKRTNSLDKSMLEPLHNMKSSLTGIIGSVELLKDVGSQDAKFDTYISILDKSAKRMSQVFQEELVGKE